MAINIEAQKQLFKNIVSKNIHRDGIDALMNWLENETDFLRLRHPQDFTVQNPVDCAYTALMWREKP